MLLFVMPVELLLMLMPVVPLLMLMLVGAWETASVLGSVKFWSALCGMVKPSVAPPIEKVRKPGKARASPDGPGRDPQCAIIERCAFRPSCRRRSLLKQHRRAGRRLESGARR